MGILTHSKNNTGVIMYLDYESFVDCLIKSGYNKIRSDLVSETWVNGWDGVEIMVDGCIFEINSFEVGD